MHRRDLIKAGLVTGTAATTGFRAPGAAEDMTARYKAWAAFGASPDWKRINADPKYNNVVGNVTLTNVAYLRPLGFSPVR